MGAEVTGKKAGEAEQEFWVGQRASFSKTVTETDIVCFAGITGDFNPVHVDAEYAKATRFKRRIAHGLLTGSLISRVLGTSLPGPGAIYLSQQLRFLAPVFIGDTITVVVEVAQVRPDKPILTLRTDCYNQRREKVVEGQAIVLAEGKPPELLGDL